MNTDHYRRQTRSFSLASTSNNNINTQNDTSINNYKDITNVENQEDTINIYHNYISIGTHNVRNFNVISKQRVFFDENLNLDIIGLTKTKLVNKLNKFTQQDNKIYKSWWTGIEDQNKTGGVGIALNL